MFSPNRDGVQPSELANILPENIRLDDEVPHIRIRSTPERQLKSEASIREIPLLGISLEAMKHARDGFPHYRDRGYLLSQTLQKAFKTRGLFCRVLTTAFTAFGTVLRNEC